MTTPKQIKSINVNSIFDKKTIKENMNKPIANLYGFVEDYKTTLTKYGEQPCFVGDFVAVNILTGETFVSDAAFLPKSFSADLLKKLDTQIANGVVSEIAFNFTLKAIDCDKNDKGYAWVAERPETEERASRRQALLDRAAKETKLALAAPEKKAK